MFSVVILSKNADNLDQCVNSIRLMGESCRVIVVDDGLARRRPDCVYVPGVKPFVFSRNANLGIEAAGLDDVFLMNDDATLLTAGGFTQIAGLRNQYLEFGVVSPAIAENTGQLNQLPGKSGGMREEDRVLCFICVFIPREVYQLIGPLDERFTAYGSDDDDYSRRVLEAGLKLGVFDPVVVGHSGVSTFRSMPNNYAMLEEGRRILREKYKE